ncbi:hypothetical protein EMPS_07177 [Entomortierella parvispora]|uniref:Uncharacterized protein n=1 Tax=Entomortierella parvispora TaxID=205924 RepID=A0A9P3HDS7_9FUNG|nr:hypothetical protein EMPS_07177 [Entomortierella parvispora]
MHLQCFKTLEDWLKWYGPLWSRQEALSWMGMLQAVTTSEDVVTDTMNAFSNLEATVIKSLDLDRSPYHTYMSALPIHVILIMKSPELIKLRWDSQDAVSILCRIAQTIPFGQNLKDLRLPSADMKSNDLKNLLTRLPKLEQLEIEHGKMDMDALGILRIESPRLLTIFKVLGLKGNISRTTGTLAHAILTSMPGLEEFSIDYITDVDICRGGGQWVCSGLKKLSMAVVLLEEGTQDMVLDMLGNLENLRTLDLSMGHIYRSIHIVPTGKHVRDFGLRISLGRGLDKLRMLHRLETYVGPQLHRTSQWKEAEARWILQHWTNLRTLREVCVNGEANDLLWFRVSGYRH